MTSTAPPMCLSCKHYRDDGQCTAYPAGIPDVILESEVDHRQPYPGDHGIQFDPQDEDAARLVAVLFGPEVEEDVTESRALTAYGCAEGVVILPHTDGPPTAEAPTPSGPATRPKNDGPVNAGGAQPSSASTWDDADTSWFDEQASLEDARTLAALRTNAPEGPEPPAGWPPSGAPKP